MAQNESIQKYFEALVASYDLIVDAIEKANARGMKFSRQLLADAVKGQQDAIELGRRFASEPADLSKFYTALLSTVTEAQGRALAFTQAAFQEAFAAGSEGREVVQKIVEANREAGRLAMEAAKSLTEANPWADVMAKAAEAFTRATIGAGTRATPSA